MKKSKKQGKPVKSTVLPGLENDKRIPADICARLRKNFRIVVWWQFMPEEFSGSVMTTPPDLREHALITYAVRATKAYSNEKDNLVYEGEDNCLPKYRQLLTTICAGYGVKPEEVMNCWTVVDFMFRLTEDENISVLPHALRYPLLDGALINQSIKTKH